MRRQEENLAPKLRLVLTAAALCIACTSMGPHREAPVRSPAPVPVFSPAVRTGSLVFLSGQVGNLPGTRELAPGGIEGQTEQALQNIRSLLQEMKLSLDDVVKCTVFLVDIRDYDAMNKVYARFFPRDPPARSTVAGSGLALGARVEIECIAAAR